MKMPESSPEGPEYDADFIEELNLIEEETEQKVSRTMSAIESALEAWNAAGKKPPEARRRIIWLREFYEDLVKWEKKSLTRNKSEGIDSKLNRLNEFVQVCSRYEQSMPEAG